MTELRIGLDIDDVLADFMSTYLDKFGKPKNDFEITKNVQRILTKDRNFWINLPILNMPNFTPTLYCTKRVNSKAWTKYWLEINSFPKKPVYQIYSQHSNKANYIKGKIDVFIDDSLSNFKAMNKVGVPCLLMDRPYNRYWGPIGRIYSLDIEEITDTYNLLMNTVFDSFSNLCD